MKITLLYPFYNSGFQMEKEVEINEENVDELINKHLDLDKFFKEKLTVSEIAQINHQRLEQYNKKYLNKKGVKKKNAPDFDNKVEGKNLTTSIKKEEINSTQCPIFEGLKKTKEGKYIVQWGT